MNGFIKNGVELYFAFESYEGGVAEWVLEYIGTSTWHGKIGINYHFHLE